ncbi:MAG: hypothetical protein ACK55I_31415, partial [bacterium]
MSHRLEDSIAAKAELSEMIALLLRCPPGHDFAATTGEFEQGGTFRVELIDFKLREKPGRQICRSRTTATEWREFSGQRLH